MQLKLISFAVALLLLTPVALGVEVPKRQENITLYLEPGEEYSFHLILEDVQPPVTLETTGDASSWVAFGEENKKNYTITSLGDQSLKVTVFVPSDAEKKNYKADIEESGTENLLSSLKITVVEPLSTALEDLRSKLNSLEEDISNLEDGQNNLKSKINSIRDKQNILEDAQSDLENIVTTTKLKVEEIRTTQKELTSIQSQFQEEKKRLENKIEELQNKTSHLKSKNQKLTQVTGAVAFNYSSLSFSIGAILGILLVVIYNRSKRGAVGSWRDRLPKISLEGLKSKLKKEEEKPKEREFDYQYKA